MRNKSLKVVPRLSDFVHQNGGLSDFVHWNGGVYVVIN